MKKLIMLLVASISLYVPVSVFAWGGGDRVGVGYITKQDNINIYSDSEGEDIDQVVNKHFPLVAYDSGSVWTGFSAMASESEKNGRLHVRYWKNGKDSSDGENTAWVSSKDILRFNFNCCGQAQCSGIKPGFMKRTYTDCYIQSLDETITKVMAVKSSDNDIEKLRLQLEIERLKLEQEKLRSGGISAATPSNNKQ